MKFDKATVRVLVRKDFGACYDFYCDKLGLVAVWGDRNGPYTSFAVKEGAAPCFAIFDGRNMADFPGYVRPTATAQPDSVVAVIPTVDIEGDYKRLKEKGVELIGEPTFMEGWFMKCVYFRDTEGNLFELNDATTI